MIPRKPGRPIGVGVQVPEVEREVRWPEVRAIARTAEDVGFDSIWVGDHLLYRFASGETRGPWEAWTQLAGLAEATERVAIGPLVAAMGFHAPFMLAKQAATVDEISGGRLVLGHRRGLERDGVRGAGRPVRPAHRAVRGGVHDRADAALRRPDRLPGPLPRRARRRAAAPPAAARRAADPRRVHRAADARRDAAPRAVVERLVRGHPQRARGRPGAPRPCRRGRARRRPRSRRHRAHRRRPRAPARAARAGRWATPTSASRCRRSRATPSTIADALLAYAREGIGHVQLVRRPDHRGVGRRAGPGPRAAGPRLTGRRTASAKSGRAGCSIPRR